MRVVALLTDDAVVSMPPQPEWHQGHKAENAFLRDRRRQRFGEWRLLETRANGQPAFAYYLPDENAGWRPRRVVCAGGAGRPDRVGHAVS